MTRPEILAFLAEILDKNCGVEVSPISEQLDLQEDLELDSVASLTLAVEIENQLEIFLGDDPESPPRKVSDIIDLISMRLGEKDSH